MTRHEALARAAELLRLHMSTPPADVLAELEAIEREADGMATDNIRMVGNLREIRDTLGLDEGVPLGALPHYVRKAVGR